MAVSKMQGSCRCRAWQATTRHLAVKKIPRSLNYLIIHFGSEYLFQGTILYGGPYTEDEAGK
jgi:hypothetical protein